MATRAPYVHTINGNHHFRRKLSGRILRVSLRTSDLHLAAHRAGTLYSYSSQLARLGLPHGEVLRLVKLRAQQLHEEGLTGAYSAPTASLPEPAALTRHPRTEAAYRTPAAPPGAPVAHPLLIHEALEDALRDLCRTGGTEHHRKYREAFSEFSELNPGAHFHDIRFADASAHLDNLLRLPRRRTDRKPFKGMPIAAVCELDIEPGQLLSATSINERVKRLGKLFDWAAEREAHAGTNPFRSRTLRLPEKPRERGRYTTEDLRVLLNSPLFTDKEYRRGAGGRRSWWWLIMLGLYTGARVGELTQLTVDDVVDVDGVLCFSINDEGEKSVKTPAGVRLCPVHPLLIELGLPEYVAQLKKAGEAHLLPYPNQNSTNPAQRASKWYCGTYRAKYLPKSWAVRGLVFHSFRHTFINRAVRELKLNLHTTQAIVGHEPDGMGETRRYARGKYSARDLNAVLEAFYYEGLNTEHLESGWQAL